MEIKDAAMIGMGQMGQLFGAAALKAGHRVTPVLRQTPPDTVLQSLPEKTPLWVTVGEKDLHQALAALPQSRRPDAILVQNELFPRVWKAAGVEEPTVAVVWISKKKGRAVEVGGETRVHGPHAEHVAHVHRALELPVEILGSRAELGQALVDKFAFILTINALGLVENKTLGQWLNDDTKRVQALAQEAALLGAAHLEGAVDEAKAQAAVEAGMNALSHYPARGRTASARVEKALADAVRLGVPVPELTNLATQHLS
jgi:ketopantoate reductase